MQRAPGEVSTMLLQHLRNGTCQTIDQLEAELPLTRRQISNGAAALIGRDYMDRVEAGCYCLTVSGLAAAERGEAITSGPKGGPLTCKSRRRLRSTFRQRAWTAMRMSGAFSVSDLVIAAAKDDKDPENNLLDYLWALRLVGYVASLPSARNGIRKNSKSAKRFRLLKDTGPVAPEWRKQKRAVWDFNLGALVEEVPCVR
ncbi:hypothetical protein [Brucella anthropi]|uniref:hypothetical protein n=1 Tax=Brucella anthropi TaxID=529 RepID=UPI00384B76BC